MCALHTDVIGYKFWDVMCVCETEKDRERDGDVGLRGGERERFCEWVTAVRLLQNP